MRLRTYATWLALCAMCFGAIAPTVSKWLASGAGRTLWVELCSETSATHAIAISIAAEEPSSHPVAGDEHCPYCALVHHLPFIPPTAAVFIAALPAMASVYTDAGIELPQTHQPRRAHAPRAPPFIS
ncbi:DUF2946 domain-containing protein [Bordetella flabilis]|uniref:DUF2946 domain-containing protein n=1 Tax=Bordetella flabilis TaxID=463014 RepID=A0A193G913_9BORD|nr:DUF2946 domain-containing protein [Bordetella flabilis]ANN76320.1 hypothetical protein BAU07_03595 [Bordetella flabilis]